MQNLKENKINGIISIYIFILFLSLVLPEGIASYSYWLPLIFASYSLYIYLSSKAILELFIIFALSSIIFIISPTNMSYGLLASLNVFLVLRLITLAKLEVTKKGFRLYYIVCIIYIFLNIVLSFIPSFYEDTEDQRFIGAFKSMNSTQTILLLMLVFCLEYFKTFKYSLSRKKILLLLIFILYLFFFNISKTRTNLFLLPYIMYNIYIYIEKKYIIVLSIISLIYITSINTDFIEKLLQAYRIGSDSSLETRQGLYDAMFVKLKENYYVFPSGFNQATEYSKLITNNSKFSAHNDFLRYWIEWGALFFVFIIVLIYRLKEFWKKNLNNILIILFYLACGLHNVLIAPHIIIPFFFILSLYYNKIKINRNNDFSNCF